MLGTIFSFCHQLHFTPGINAQFSKRGSEFKSLNFHEISRRVLLISMYIPFEFKMHRLLIIDTRLWGIGVAFSSYSTIWTCICFMYTDPRCTCFKWVCPLMLPKSIYTFTFMFCPFCYEKQKRYHVTCYRSLQEKLTKILYVWRFDLFMQRNGGNKVKRG